MKRAGCLLATIAVLLVFAAVPCLAEGEGELSVTYDCDVDFPGSLTFNVTAESSAPITRIVFCYRIDKISSVEVTSFVDVDFYQAPVVEASWTWDMRKYSLPPGAEVQYRWRVEDGSGADLISDWESVRFEDDRYEWKEMGGGNVTLFWYRGGQAFCHDLMEAAEEALNTLNSDTGASLEEPVRVYVYGSSSDLRGAMVYPQEWMGGVAFPEHGIVAIGVAPVDVGWGERAMRHEVAHLVTYQMTHNPYGDIPTWLDEGLSVYAEGEEDLSFGAALDEAIHEDSVISVQTLSSNFPATVSEARLSYAESRNLVEFLINRFGRQKMMYLLETFQEGDTYDGALQKVYGFDTLGLDNLWRKNLGLEPRQPETPVGADGGPEESPAAGVLGCQAVSAQVQSGGVPVAGIVGVVLVPGFGEAIRLLVCWRRRRK